MSDIFLSRNFPSIKLLIEQVKLKQQDQFLQKWNSDIALSSEGKIYAYF